MSTLAIKIDKDGEVQICIDEDYEVHADRKEHSGLFLIIGRGFVVNVSKKLRLVVIS